MADVEEGSGLISNDIFPSAMKNFLVMSTTFGVVHGSITVAIAYATSVFSLSLGSYSSGFLYSTYTLTSLLCAAPFVERFGARDMMLISFIFYFLYLVFFVIGSQVDDVTTRWFFVITGAIFGGIASGIGWVSQGVYFATSAEYYTKEKGMTKHEANSMFASYFASIYIGFQSLLYLLSSLLLEFTSFSEEDLFIVYSILTFLCLILVSLYLVQLPSKPDEASSMDHIKAVVMMTFTDVRAITIAPMAITFGFISVFTASYINDKVVSEYIGTYSVGYLGVVQTATVSLFSIPVTYLLGTEGVLVVGSFCYALVAGAFIEFSDSQLGHWKYIWAIYVLYGIARISWETTTKAIVADFFPRSKAAGFANLNFVAGLCSTLYSFLVSDLSAAALSICFLVPALLIVPGYVYALSVPSSD